jgi:hypothetical protein
MVGNERTVCPLEAGLAPVGTSLFGGDAANAAPVENPNATVQASRMVFILLTPCQADRSWWWDRDLLMGRFDLVGFVIVARL